MKKCLGFAALLVAVFAAGCSSSSGASGTPAVVNVYDALNQNVSTTITGIFPTEFVATFDHEMDLASAQAAGAITLICGDLVAAGLSVAHGGSNNDMVITITDPWKYALMNCTLTFTTAVKSLGGSPMVADASYVFTNACAVNDDFNAETISDSGVCWDVYEGSPLVEVLWSSLANILTLNTVNSSLDATFAEITSPAQIILQKIAGTSSSGFEIEIMIEQPANLIYDGAGAPSTIAAVLGDSAQLDLVSNQIVIGLMASSGEMNCAVSAFNLTGPVSVYQMPCTDTTETYYVKYSTIGGTATFQYRVEGDSIYTDLQHDASTGDWPALWDFSGSGNRSLMLYFNSYGLTPAETGNIGFINTSGVTVQNQY